nr:MAG TPA: hypothetical protein [Siphoviridae sp. ctBWu8]
MLYSWQFLQIILYKYYMLDGLKCLMCICKMFKWVFIIVLIDNLL